MKIGTVLTGLLFYIYIDMICIYITALLSIAWGELLLLDLVEILQRIFSLSPSGNFQYYSCSEANFKLLLLKTLFIRSALIKLCLKTVHMPTFTQNSFTQRAGVVTLCTEI